MDVAFILDKYFKGTADVSIDVFDAQTLNAVYLDVINAMTSHLEIEVSVLQTLSYCLYEMMDIRASLAENEKFKDITEPEALKLYLEDNITDGKGMGFGLYTTSRLVNSIGKEFILHSGSHKLIIQDGSTSVIENGFWQGTLIYMEIGTGEEIDPNQIVKRRTTFRGLNPLAERSVLVALQRRYKVQSNN